MDNIRAMIEARSNIKNQRIRELVSVRRGVDEVIKAR